MIAARARFALAGALLTSCASSQPALHSAPSAASSARVAAQPSAPSPSLARSTPASQEPQAAPPRACGALNCQAFATPQAAFAYVLEQKPRVLGVGEAHAQQETANIFSSTRRFAQQLLPLLAGKSKHIVIELLVANCRPQTVTGVAKAQAPVTKPQAQTNQSEFLMLGKYAQRLGIEPQALAPPCADYDAVIAAGDDGVDRLLTLVAAQTQKSVEALLAGPDPATDIVLTYGGALHNDLYPRPGQEAWSFGPRLAAVSQGRYVELDLIVPEFVKDSEAWRNLPWFAAFDREHLSNETLLYQPAPSSFALVFPKTHATPPDAQVR